MLAYSDIVRRVAALQKEQAARLSGGPDRTAATIKTPLRGGRAAKGASNGRGGHEAGKASGPAPFNSAAWTHLKPAESGPEPVRQSRAATFAETMGAIDAEARGDDFDPAGLVAGPRQQVRRVTGSDLIRVQRQMAGVS